MAAQGVHIDKVHLVEIPENNNHHQKQPKDAAKINYSVTAQWLRAAVLGANEGLVSIASLIMGIGAVKRDVKDMLHAGFAGLVAGACSMAIGEYVSVHTQLDIEIAQMKRDKGSSRNNGENNNNNPEEMKRKDEENDEENHEKLPNPMQAALASAVSFSTGGLVPLLSAAFIQEYRLRVAVASVALAVFGGVGAALGRSRVGSSCIRVLVGGWLAMGVTYGLTQLIDFSGVNI